MRYIGRNRIRIVLLLSCLLLTACVRGSNTETLKDSGPANGNDQKGYLYANADSVLFLQWTEINGKLIGQMNVFFAKGSRGKSTGTSSHSFEGVSDGKNISLNFTGSQWTDALGGRTWTGTISGNDLTLVIPASNGTLSPVNFNAGTVEQYNHTVLSIKQGVQANNTRVQKENAEASRIEAEKNAVNEGNNRVRSALNALMIGINQVENAMKFENVFADYARTWDKMKTDHKNLVDKAAERPLTSYQIGNLQYLLGTLQYDIGAFESHAGTLDYNLARVDGAIKSVREAQNDVRDSWQRLQYAVSANSTGSPDAQFSDADISPLIRVSNEKIQSASQAIKEASKRRAQYHSQAKDLYAKDDAFVKSIKAVN